MNIKLNNQFKWLCRYLARTVWQHRYRLFGGVCVVVLLGLSSWIGIAWWRARLIAPPPTLYLQDRQGRFLGEVGAAIGNEFGYWRLESLPPRVAAATLAAEDRRFWLHPGIDPLAMSRAVVQNLRSRKRLSGASTLAMQVARMQTPGARGYLRKATEALTAFFFIWRHGREAVLRHYLEIVPYGNRIHGISYASRRYFDKPLEDLSWAETCFLAAIPQSPARMNPFTELGRRAAAQRGDKVLERLYSSKALSREEYELARDQIQSLEIRSLAERPRNSLHAILRLEGLLANPQLQSTLACHPIVTTTLDLDLQEEVAWKTFEALRSWERDGAGNGAVIVLDRTSNEVLAWVGSSDYFDSAHAGAIDYTGVIRSPGSALKPFFYALALERGVITPATILDDIERGAGGITNADESYLGPLLPRLALANSRNVPAANLLFRIGLDEGYAFLRDLGLHNGTEPARRYGLGLAIGGMPVTLEQLVRAYTVFSREGQLGDLLWYQGQSRQTKRLLSEETTRQVTLYLADPLARLPSFSRMGPIEYPFPVAVKTGTSSRFRDAWTIAFSTRYVVGVWIGDPDFQPMNQLTGFRCAAELAQKVLFDLHRDETAGLADLSFPPPRGFEALRLCALSGQLATNACDRAFVEWFRPGTSPFESCKAHLLVAVDSRSGRPAATGTPAEFVEVHTFVDLPPHYAEWAVSAGIPRLPESLSVDFEKPSTWRWKSQKVHLSIISPENGLRLLRDPETPADNSTLALKAVVDPPVPQLLWYVDGQPLQLVEYPYTARWMAKPGEHVFQVRLPQTPIASSPISVSVQ